MSKEAIKKFQEEAKSNKDLQDKIIEAGSDLDQIVSIAGNAGFDFTKEELVQLSEEAKSQLSDDDLDKVAGGSGKATAVTVTGCAVTVCVGVI